MMEQTHKHGHSSLEHRYPNELAKLRVLLPHWIDHNEEHAASFRRWADKARALGQEETAQRIEEAVERMAACSQALAAALKELEK